MTRDEKFKLYYESFKNNYKKALSDQEIVDRVNWLLDKQESLPKTKQSISVQYYDFLLDVNDIEVFRNNFEKAKVELGHYNKSGDLHNAFDPADIIILINDPYIIGVASNLVTEFIKSLYRKVRGEKITIVSPSNEKRRDIIFEVVTKEEGLKTSTYRIEGKLSDEQVDRLIDKIPAISAENNSKGIDNPQELEKRFSPNEEKTNWGEYDLLEQIKKARASDKKD